MTLKLPVPNVEARFGQELSPREVSVKLREIQQNFDAIALSLARPGRRDYGEVTSLPSSPNAGDRCQYWNSTFGVLWELQYRSTGWWHKKGGFPLRWGVSGNTKTTSTTPVNSPTAITAPLTMQFGGEFGASPLGTTLPGQARARLYIDGSATSCSELVGSSGAESVPIQLASTLTYPEVKAGKIVSVRPYISVGAGEGHYWDLYLEIDPIKVK